MNFTVFASFMIVATFFLWVKYEIKKHNRYDKKLEKEFREREWEANTTRKKSLDGLSYIAIPLESLPLNTFTDDEEIRSYIEIIQDLSQKKIVDFTGISNTDLKLTYGAANLPVLTEYDQNHTTLIMTLQNWGQKLFDNNYKKECTSVLEYAVSCGSDISSTFRLLANIYTENNEKDKLSYLKSTATHLHSAMQKPIVRMLQEFDL